jgi:hypothetical protein
MNAWANFWGAWIVVSGIAFAVITAIVAWKGFGDLRAMFRDLGAEKGGIDRERSGRPR